MCPTHTISDVSQFEFQKEEFWVMKSNVFEDVVKRFPEATLLMFAGVWEPLINPYFFDIIEIWARHKKMMNIVSNGTLLDEGKVEKLMQNKRINQISISLNAANEEDYGTICHTKAKTFYSVVEGIKKLVDSKKKYKSHAQIIVSAVCSEQFIDKVYDFVKFASSLWVDRIDIHNYIDFSIVEKSDQWTLIPWEESIEAKLNTILKNIRKLNLSCEVNFPVAINKNKFQKKCEWYFKNLSVDAYWNIWSCWRVMSPNAKYGSFSWQEDVRNGKYMQYMRKLFLNPHAKMPTCCTTCVENF